MPKGRNVPEPNSELEFIKYQNIEGQRILVDGKHYEGCTFKDCIIEIGASKTFGLVDNTYDHCRFGFVGPAALTVEFMTKMYHDFGSEGKRLLEETFDNIRKGEHDSIP